MHKPFFLLLVWHREVTGFFVKRTYLLHFLVSQYKVEHVNILLDVSGIRRARDDRKAFLDMPTDDDLGCRLTMSLCNLIDSGIT